MRPTQVFRPTGNPVIDDQTFQTNDFLQRFFRDVPFLNGVLLKDLSLDTTAIDVNHTLGRAFSGYLILKRSSGETVFNNASPDAIRVINLEATGPVTIDLWVF